MAEKRVPVKKVANAVLYSNGLIKIEKVRLSFPRLDKPKQSDDGGVPKYEATGMLSKKTHKEAMELVRDEINKVCQGKKWWKDGKRTIPADKIFLKDGDAEGARPEYAGHWTVVARELESKPPILRNLDGRTNIERADAARVLYAGCYINLVLNPWPQDNKFGKRVNANLRMVQFAARGEPLATGGMGEEDADDILDAADDDGVTQADEREEEDAL
jgi:hypothetical protein